MKEKSIMAAQASSFWGDKYVTKKVRVVSHARNKPTEPYPCLYENIIKIFQTIKKL